MRRLTLKVKPRAFSGTVSMCLKTVLCQGPGRVRLAGSLRDKRQSMHHGHARTCQSLMSRVRRATLSICDAIRNCWYTRWFLRRAPGKWGGFFSPFFSYYFFSDRKTYSWKLRCETTSLERTFWSRVNAGFCTRCPARARRRPCTTAATQAMA